MANNNKWLMLDMDGLIEKLGYELNQTYILYDQNETSLIFDSINEKKEPIICVCQDGVSKDLYLAKLLSYLAFDSYRHAVWIVDQKTKQHNETIEWLSMNLKNQQLSFFESKLIGFNSYDE